MLPSVAVQQGSADLLAWLLEAQTGVASHLDAQCQCYVRCSTAMRLNMTSCRFCRT